eukprot:8243520-Alexandrium_andersonii.AAC.1
MADTYKLVVGGCNSVTRQIMYSPLIQNWFQALQLGNDIAMVQHVANMRWAGHRFDSVCKPLCRAMLFWPAFVG